MLPAAVEVARRAFAARSRTAMICAAATASRE